MVKIICAGFQKTGTKSLSRALEKLNYKVYDAGETYTFMRKTWMDFFKGKIRIEDVCQKYDDLEVDVVVDGPANYFWEEMANYWPKAKIILTIRDNEDKWYQSLLQFYHGTVKWCGKLAYLGVISPYGLMTERYLTMPYHRLVFGSTNFHPLVQDFNNKNNETIYKRKYREHNSYVQNQADPKRLLVMNVKEGWKPLCQFINHPVPKESFPFRNKGGETGEFLDDLVEYHIRRCKIEVASVLSLMVLIPILIAYFMNGSSVLISNIFTS